MQSYQLRPKFMTAEMKHMLRKKNYLMRRNRLDEAEAISNKIGSLIMKHNSNELKSIKRNDSKSLWKEVNRINHVIVEQ